MFVGILARENSSWALIVVITQDGKKWATENLVGAHAHET